jgi:apoptosis-inducing factor 3
MSKREIAVANLSELKDGEMKEVSAGETKILLARVDGTCYAVGAHCTHYGAPLVDGMLSGDRIVCPWHHACFNARTGDLEEPPALDSLPGFDVRVAGGKILVSLPEDVTDRRTPKMTTHDAHDNRLFVILGGGAAGYSAAQTLREDGFTGRVLVISSEDRLPYDRPNLSKDYLQGHAEPEWMPLRAEEFLAEHDIELMLDKEVVSVDATKKTVRLSDGQTLTYDSLLVATGGTPRKLPFQSVEQENVFLLRGFSDSDAIIGAADKGKRAIVIGASFIGMEAASSLKIRGCEVTVVAPDEVPFANILGLEIGKLFQHIHEQNGVKFKLGTQVRSFEGGARVEAVVLENGERLEADLIVVGVGVKPATDFLTGFELHKDGGVIADKHLCIAKDLYAAGDIAHFPDSRSGAMTRIEHWRTALQQGSVAAHNMAGKPTPFTSVPFFWTTQFDATLNYVGHAKDWDRILIQGDVLQKDFVAFYIKGANIQAVAGMNRDREMAAWEERMRLNQMPTPDRLDDRSVGT